MSYEDSLKNSEFAHSAFTEESEELNEEEEQSWQDLYSGITSAASNFYGALNALSQANTDAQISEIERLRDSKLAAIDAETQATLEALGIQEATTLETLQAELDAAILAGDTKTASDLQDEIDRTVILEEAEARKLAIEEKATEDSNKLKREQAKKDRALQSFNAVINTASAIIGFLANPGGFAGVGLSVAAGLTGAAEIGAINSAPLPTFATGGIVMKEGGKSLTGDQHLARVNPKEMILNESQQAQLFKMANGSGGSNASNIMIQLYMDTKVVAQGVARNFNNGIVKVALK